jgi:hypothetical protein
MVQLLLALGKLCLPQNSGQKNIAITVARYEKKPIM